MLLIEFNDPMIDPIPWTIKESYIGMADVSRVVMETKIGRSMFSCTNEAIARQAYKDAVENRLGELRNLDYMASEVVSFKKLCTLDAGKLVHGGMSSYEEIASSIVFETAECGITITCPSDEWEFRFYASCVCSGISSDYVPKLPWEDALFPTGVPGFGNFEKVMRLDPA